jgi:hypothetical protein
MYLISMLLRPNHTFLKTRTIIYEEMYAIYSSVTKIVFYNEQKERFIIHKVQVIHINKILNNAFNYCCCRRKQCHREG